jgi:hypothetical protein
MRRGPAPRDIRPGRGARPRRPLDTKESLS